MLEGFAVGFVLVEVVEQVAVGGAAPLFVALHSGGVGLVVEAHRDQCLGNVAHTFMKSNFVEAEPIRDVFKLRIQVAMLFEGLLLHDAGEPGNPKGRGLEEGDHLLLGKDARFVAIGEKFFFIDRLHLIFEIANVGAD